MSSWTALASTVRLNQPNMFASSSSPRTRTPAKPAALAWRSRSAGVNACTSTSDSSAWSSGGAPLPPAASRAPTARRQSGAAASPARLGTAAIRSP